jgi:hypothetical protein
MTYLIDVYGTVIDEATGTAYPDAVQLLHALGNEAILISRADSREAIIAALPGVPRLTILLTGGGNKADFLAEHPHLVPMSTVFVDDSPDQLEGMAEKFPHAKLFEIRRDGGAGDGRFPVVRSLSELP